MSGVSNDFMCPPILLIGFNRPDYMAEQISAIRPARPNRVYIAVDGPRSDRPGEDKVCSLVRDCTKLVDWPCEIKTLFRTKNLGCKHGVSGAITWFFENESEGIILEDDCRPAYDFFRFAGELLERYRDDERIGAICGFNFFNLQQDKAASYHFSSRMDVWGWASWRRVWKFYDVEIANNRTDDVLKAIEESNLSAYNKKVHRRFVKEVRNGLSTWDVQFSLLFMVKKMLSIVPRERLIANVGLASPQATHTGGYVYWNKRWSQTGRVVFPLCHPDAVVCDDNADKLHDRIFGAFFPRALTWLGCKVPIVRDFLDSLGKRVESFLPILFRL